MQIPLPGFHVVDYFPAAVWKELQGEMDDGIQQL